MIQFACPNPNCARRYNADAKHADQRFKCPACQTVLHRVVPVPAPVRPPPVIKREVAEGTLGNLQAHADQANDQIDFVCTHCHAKNQALTSAVGTTVRCPDCGRQTVVAALLAATESSKTPPPLKAKSHGVVHRKRQVGAAADVAAADVNATDVNATEALVNRPPPTAARPAQPASSDQTANRDASSAEWLRRQQLRIVAGQIRRVMLIEETIDQATRKLRELEQADGSSSGADSPQ